ncbi:zinc finger protein 431-like [Belonocnema kinseyi]|uniref:zinc finger protein 431-like n=1 Tax=Belonocnema kinseyi TaxID=2817044 RepID=UPI00143DB550|nr:zinc finger protein 431-like [Belonocnema kinseyi]
MSQEQPNSKSELTNSTESTNVGSYSCTTADISSGNKSGAKKLIIEYDVDETLEIKEEIIEDQGTLTSLKRDKKFESKLFTVYINEDNTPTVNENLWSQKKPKFDDSKPEKKYTCEKCARTYKQEHTLKSHQKFDCDVLPQFNCKFCGKLFKRKNHMTTHVRLLHLKLNSQTSKTKYHCNICTRSYSSSCALSRHIRLKHAPVKPKFICDYCNHKTNLKCSLSKHINSLHLK